MSSRTRGFASPTGDVVASVRFKNSAMQGARFRKPSMLPSRSAAIPSWIASHDPWQS